MKKGYRIVIPFLMAVVMLLLFIASAFLSGGNVLSVLANGKRTVLLWEEETESETDAETVTEDETESSPETEVETESESETAVESESETLPETEAETETETDTETESETIPETEEVPEKTENESVSENDIEPNVRISIFTPSGWYKTHARVPIGVEELMGISSFKIARIEAKISQNGSYMDITEDKAVEISENCSIYVRVTDRDGNRYEKNRYIECFDKENPVLNASISDGILNVQAMDNDSGIKAVYVNGYEFTTLTDGTLNVRLQQYDTGYEYFTLQALDYAGNMSQIYRMSNPYYTDPQRADEQENQSTQLPVNAKPTEPTEAKATVVEHATENVVQGPEAKKESYDGMDEKGYPETEDLITETSESGKEFYTIMTKSDKVFYLIIDRDSSENNVFLLTEVSENDLLNFSDSDAQTLPKGTMVVESALPQEEETAAVEAEPETETVEEPETAEEQDSSNNAAFYVLLAVIGLGTVGGYYFMKKMRSDDEYDEEEEPEDEEEYEEEYTEEE